MGGGGGRGRGRGRRGGGGGGRGGGAFDYVDGFSFGEFVGVEGEVIFEDFSEMDESLFT